jgi:hypothetical protein
LLNKPDGYYKKLYDSQFSVENNCDKLNWKNFQDRPVCRQAG